MINQTHWGEIHRNCSRYHGLQGVWKLHIWKYCYISWGLTSSHGSHDILSLSDTHVHQQTRPSLVQIMACGLFSTKPLSASILVYYFLHPWEKNPEKYESKYNNVCNSQNEFDNGICKNGSHFISDSIQYTASLKYSPIYGYIEVPMWPNGLME